VKVEKYPKGNFLAPTIIADMNTNMKAYKTEIFGPVLCVISVDTLEEAIEVNLLQLAYTLGGFVTP
jgi:malonate-semialdehyde dehydrogenase (acetylating)/methylmalonate-semialdehyde dehydrogenase